MVQIIQDLLIGKNIKRIREQCELTQRVVVEKMQLLGSDISITSLDKIEISTQSIEAADLKRLKKILNVSFDEFFKE